MVMLDLSFTWGSRLDVRLAVSTLSRRAGLLASATSVKVRALG